ncbi:outer membrane beta-barrel protein [Mucilaginibacter lutimaris]|uniref:Outer membrane beta-barrel protein n=1 Tax=Mucilaginibacter lutimaris TaxID=931629 RepID=A0ABW2ZD11_9SPHI
MKKVLFLLTVLCGISISSFAQSSSESGKFSIGVEAGLPVGKVKDYSNFAIGGSLKYDHPIATGTFVTLSAGYNKFLSNDDAKTIDYKLYAIPVKVGLRYFLAENFYGEAQLGAAFVNESVGGISGNTTTFAYSPGVGYNFGGGVDLGVRYEGWSKSGTTVSQVAARLAYSF